MLKNYFVIAWRQILKNKLYAAINISGLVMGLAVFLFGSMLVSYERSHDTFYENSKRIFTAGSLFSPSANIGVSESNGIYTGFAKHIDELEEVEAVARTVRREFLLSKDDKQFYEQIRFTDPSLLDIFDFQFIEGDDRALDDPSGIILTRSAAGKFFGDEPALGQVLTLDHDVSLHVTGVMEDLPRNTHFVSDIGSEGFDFIAPLQALNKAAEYDLTGNFNNLSSSDFTYILLDESKNAAWLQPQLDGIFERHYPHKQQDLINGLKARPLVEANTILWDAVGLPILDSIRVLALLVLVVAVVNYTNLATAQSLGRAREIGLRKTMGASRSQLATQFQVESLCMAMIAMLIALAILEVAIPAFNAVLNRALTLDYASTLPWLVFTTLAVGVVAGAYPAYLISRASPIDALREGNARSGKGSHFRSIMLVLQFSISIFMLAMVMVVYLQNKKIENSSEMYPRSQIINLHRLDVEPIQARLETLRNELLTLPGVEHVTYSSQLPFEGSNSSFSVSRTGDEDTSFLLTQVIIDEHFLSTYNIPLLLGRNLTPEIAADTLKEGVLEANLIINELGVERLGFSSPEEAIGGVFYDHTTRRESRAYTIVGVMPDQNFQGFHNQIKPTVFFMEPADLRYASIRVKGVGLGDTLGSIESVWDGLIEDYPIQSQFLDELFNKSFQVYSSVSSVLGGFAFIALSLSMIGLFGLAAFTAQARTKEIGVRKVMGASTLQIVRLLIWQFSRPVIWALLFALPLAYFAANTYLEFFADRITLTELIVSSAGALAVAFAWIIVGIHAVRIAGANPIRALRYE